MLSRKRGRRATTTHYYDDSFLTLSPRHIRSSHRTRFPVKRLINEVYTRPEKDFHRKQKDENLYDVSVVEIDARSKWIKVHYLGWDAKFDE